jgi:ABC-type multidrug transport system fused ATPase/permease subunit
MSTDASRVDYGAEYFHQSWTSVIQMCVILVILLINIGYSALAGFGLLLVCGPVLGKVIRQLHNKRRKSTKFTDARVRLMQEILGSMRAIKFYTWETPFLKRVAEIRKSELKIVKYLLLLKAGINAVSLSIPIYASILAFTTYSVVGNTLEPAKIFSSLTLFNLMRNPLMYLPKVISASIDAWVALGRMQSMLLAEELESPDIDSHAEFAVSVWGGKFVWEAEERVETVKAPKNKWWQRKSKRQSTINPRISTISTQSKDTKRRSQRFSRNLDSQSVGFALEIGGSTGFQIKHGEFVVIVGEIGSGKSSLLAALVGEMRRTNGMVTLGGKVAFCPQTAWIQNATVKDNILFGQEYDRDKYNQVIHDCALEQDIDMLPGGDLTEIGERGVTLSGGQKARINIARAAYSDVDIYLLDDPLSAVDAHVGRHLIEECICGLMAGKTRILVTHQLQVLPHADRVFYMHDGKIVEEGTYRELLDNGGDFAHLVEKFGGKEEEKAEAPAEHEGPKAPIRKRRSVLMGNEERATGSVKRAVYFEYARAAGGFWIIPAIVAAVILSNGGNLAMSIWLSAWTSHRFPVSENAYIAGYAALGFSQGFFLFVYSFTLTSTGNRATKKMHDKVSTFISSLIVGPQSDYLCPNVVLR